MLKTKDDIKAEKAKQGGQQLDLVDTLKEQKKQANNKKFATYSLFITLIISSLLWAYTETRKIMSHQKTVKLPRLDLKLPKLNPPATPLKAETETTEEVISQNLDLENGLWSFYYLLTDANETVFEYQKNLSQLTQAPNELLSHLEEIPKSTSSDFSQNLPQGLELKENFFEDNDTFQVEILINLPDQRRVFLFSKNANPQDIQLAKQELQNLLPKIYWHIMSNS